MGTRVETVWRRQKYYYITRTKEKIIIIIIYNRKNGILYFVTNTEIMSIIKIYNHKLLNMRNSRSAYRLTHDVCKLGMGKNH